MSRKQEFQDNFNVSLSGWEAFVPLSDGERRFYGGDQAWFNWSEKRVQTRIAREAGCGTVAAANIAAYMAGKEGMGKLYPPFHWDRRNFLSHMEEVYRYVKPRRIFHIPLGIWPASRFYGGFIRFAESKNIAVTPVVKTRGFTYRETKEFIRSALKKDAPVAMLIGFAGRRMTVEYENGQRSKGDFSLHWVTLVRLETVEAAQKEEDCILYVSSWGRLARIRLREYLQTEPLYRCLVYFLPAGKEES